MRPPKSSEDSFPSQSYIEGRKLIKRWQSLVVELLLGCSGNLGDTGFINHLWCGWDSSESSCLWVTHVLKNNPNKDTDSPSWTWMGASPWSAIDSLVPPGQGWSMDSTVNQEKFASPCSYDARKRRVKYDNESWDLLWHAIATWSSGSSGEPRHRKQILRGTVCDHPQRLDNREQASGNYP